METSASNNFHVLIAAAGSGTRLSGDRPKQYMKMGGKAILRHTIEAFMACECVKDVRVVIDFQHKNYYEEAVQGLSLAPPIAGGKTRKDSVFNGIKGFSNLEDHENILIHDAARPFVKQDDILNLVRVLGEKSAATLGVPVSDSLRQEDGTLMDRTGLWAVQTPQGFHYGVIRDAHEQADPAIDYKDDTSLVSVMGVDVAIVRGHRQNFKITTTDDWEMAERLLRREVRTGTGYDVHAFTDGGESVRLCGIDIPHDKALSGHSDADAGLHALTDALLGAIAAGDIGQHFPPSDPQWKGADSAVFLRQAVKLVRDQGGVITGLDLTLICEAPKIGPHRTAMQQRVADICGLSPARVSIKATTTEGLGFTGRGEGIAAQAMATVELPRVE